MTVPLIGTVQLSKTVLEIPPNATKNFEQGDLSLPDEMMNAYCPWIALRVAQDFTALAAANGNTLSADEKTALLGASYFGYAYGGKYEKDQHRPFWEATFADVNLEARRHLERSWLGLTDTDNGLGKTIATGLNTFNYVIYVPTGHEEAFTDASSLGLGFAQIKAMLMQFKRAGVGDPLHTANSNLTLGNMRVAPWVEPKKVGQGMLHVDPPYWRRYTWDKKDATKPQRLSDGLPRAAYEMTHPTSAAVLQAVDVKIGKDYVAQDPATPTDILNTYTAHVDVGTTENTSDVATVLLAIPDTKVSDLKTGELTVRQVVGNQTTGEWGVSNSEVPSEELLKKDLASVAKLLPQGESAKAVYNALVEGKTYEAELVPHFGYRVFLRGDDGFKTFPGYIVTKVADDKYTYQVDVETFEGKRLATRYAAAASMGDVQAKQNALADLLKHIPGSMIDSAGLRGGTSSIASQAIEKLQALAGVK